MRKAYEEAKTSVYGPDRSILKKVDDLSWQIAALSIFLRTKLSEHSHAHGHDHSHLPRPGSPGNERARSNCKKTGYRTNMCPDNPHCNTRCPRCEKLGHDESTSWTKLQTHCRVFFENYDQGAGPSATNNPGSNEIFGVVQEVLTESSGDAIAATTKSTAEGEPLPKHCTTAADIVMRNASFPVRIVHGPPAGQGAQFTKRSSWKKRNRQKQKKYKQLRDQVRGYNVMYELANASCGFTLLTQG